MRHGIIGECVAPSRTEASEVTNGFRWCHEYCQDYRHAAQENTQYPLVVVVKDGLLGPGESQRGQ